MTATTMAEAREMRRLYVDEGLSMPRIAAMTGRSRNTVRSLLVLLGVPRRGQDVTDAEAAEMAALYAQRVSMVEVARLTGRSMGCVHRALHRLDVRINRQGRNLRPSPRRTPHDQVERILETYRQTRCQHDTAKLLGLSQSTVRWHLTQAGEPLVPRKENAHGGRPITAEQEALICRLYTEGVLVAEIQEAAGVSRSTVTNVLRRNEVSYRGRVTGARGAWVKRRGRQLASAA